MARIKTNIHQRVINFCGKCGVILGSDIEAIGVVRRKGFSRSCQEKGKRNVG